MKATLVRKTNNTILFQTEDHRMYVGAAADLGKDLVQGQQYEGVILKATPPSFIEACDILLLPMEYFKIKD
jgi:hypothetical protein